MIAGLDFLRSHFLTQVSRAITYRELESGRNDRSEESKVLNTLLAKCMTHKLLFRALSKLHPSQTTDRRRLDTTVVHEYPVLDDR